MKPALPLAHNLPASGETALREDSRNLLRR